MPQISKGRLEHLEECSQELTRVLGENERLQALDTEGLAHMQEENRVRSVAIAGQQKEITRLSTEGSEALASLEFLLNLSVPGNQDWDGYMVAVRNECRRGLAAVQVRQQ